MEAVGITEQLYTQQLPYSLEAEQSVLGAIFIDPACITRVMEYIKPESFYRPQHHAGRTAVDVHSNRFNQDF